MIGIIVPFYKNEAFIHRCLDSLFAQTFIEYKIIAVDDGSPDRCGEICDEYAEKHPNFSVIHQNNQGLSAARNAGLEMALTDNEIDWITFVDGDDWVHRDYLLSLHEACVRDNTLFSVAGFVNAWSDDAPEEKSLVDPGIYAPDDLMGLDYMSVPAITSTAKLIHKSIIGDIRFPEGKIHEDVYTTYKWLFSVPNVSVVDAKFYYRFYNPQGIMNSKWSERHLDVFQAWREQSAFYLKNDFMKSYKKSITCYLWDADHFLKETKNNGKARQKIKRSLKQYYQENKQGMTKEQINYYKIILHPKCSLFGSKYVAFFSTARTDGVGTAIKKTLSFVKNANKN